MRRVKEERSMLKTEMKKVICSLTFLLFVICMVGTYITQMMPDLDEVITRPEPGQEIYGFRIEENADILMPAATESLLSEYLTGYYQAYPYMFYKEVHLKAADEKKMADILQKLTGLTKEELDGFTGFSPGGYTQSMDENGNMTVQYREAVLPAYTLSESISYEQFKELMGQADELIGGGSAYAVDKLVSHFSELPLTYEEALAEYEEIVSPEQIGAGYTRLFCDYMGIFAAVIAVFAAAFYWNMDHRAKVSELVYSRRIGTVRLVVSRICALMLCMVPVIVLPYVHMMFQVNGLYPELSIQWSKATLLMLYWLLPELLFVTVLAALITEIISPYLAIFLQGAWWYTALEMNELVGDISKWTLVLRHNSLGDLSAWNNEFGNFLVNRTFYLGCSVLLIVILVLVYDWKRKGKMNFGRKGVSRSAHKESANCV